MEREQMESAAGGARGFVARPDAAVAAVAVVLAAVAAVAGVAAAATSRSEKSSFRRCCRCECIF